MSAQSATQNAGTVAALNAALESLKAGDLDAALDTCRALLEREPELGDALHVAGFVHQMRGEHRDAVHYFAHAQQVAPENVEVLNNFAASLKELGRYDQSERYYLRALEINPQYALASHNFADLLLTLDRPAEAIARCRAAIAAAPEFANTYFTLGRALGEQRRHAEAIEAFREGVARGGPQATGELAEALLHLLQGDFTTGWEMYEARLRAPDGSAPLASAESAAYPRWRGAKLEGRTILVREEQGIGDELMFASCLPDLMAIAGRCVIVCSARLQPLLQRSWPAALVLADNAPRLAEAIAEAGIDFQIPSGSLPLVFRSRAADFPDHRGYLRADATRVAALRERLAALGPGPRIGLSWRGGTPGTGRERRSMPLSQLQPLLRRAGTHWISLQYDEGAAEEVTAQARTGIRIEHWPEIVSDPDETAALIAALDMSLSVCTAVVHLAGALGQPVWVMVPWVAEWRYGAEGDRMHWYPSARLYRQPVPGDWDTVIRSVGDALELRYPS